MRAMRRRLDRLAIAAASYIGEHGPVRVEIFMPDNGRGGPGPGTYRSGGVVVTVYRDEEAAEPLHGELALPPERS